MLDKKNKKKMRDLRNLNNTYIKSNARLIYLLTDLSGCPVLLENGNICNGCTPTVDTQFKCWLLWSLHKDREAIDG